MKYLVIGLGNIGPEYELTRHNVGFLILDRLADENKLSWESDRLAFTSLLKHKGRQIHLIKPTTYMNLSGKAVNYWMKVLKIPKENVLVVVDDIALPFGKLRLKAKGSSAGHNGLKNIEELTGGQDYARLKFGIGDDYPKGRQIDYVLGRWSKEEINDLPIFMDKAIEMITAFCTIGLEKTMNFYNK
ncbi:aminoacyl-tRNA hydrolase [uncultured Cyclobacterium sp.]|uniref:aminoacyl-tRNA hydrolase n=1 Tax=uncultured Cyclobacterium sp. TaxID=453820 RepID=UPI0030ECD2D6|tara:strand:+ start:77528 stop:78088 length:561 start_codon:yes stop_codon:yes gene_type:complete